jgi:hypothetical protein
MDVFKVPLTIFLTMPPEFLYIVFIETLNTYH